MLAGRLGVVILGYRSDQAERRGLALARQGLDAADLTVVVNLTEQAGDSRVLASSSNLGYAAGMNRGIAASGASGHEYVALLTHDVEVNLSTLYALVEELASDRRLAAVAPQLYDEHGRLFSVGGGRHAGGVFHLPPSGEVGLRSVDWLDGAVVVARVSALMEVGGFDDRYFLYGEDVDLCFRLRRAGWYLAVSYDHRAAQTVGAIAGRRGRAVAYLATRNLVETYRKDGGTRAASGVAMRQCYAALWSNEPWKYRWAKLRGVLDATLRHFGPPPEALLRDSDIKLVLP